MTGIMKVWHWLVGSFVAWRQPRPQKPGLQRLDQSPIGPITLNVKYPDGSIKTLRAED